LAQAVCQAIGPTISLTLAAYIGYNFTFALAGCFTLCAVFAASRINLPYRKKCAFKISPKSIVAKESLLPAIILFFLQMTFCNINAFLVIFADKRGIANIGFFYTMYAVTMLFAPRLAGKLSDKWGAGKAIIPALIFFGLSLYIISVSSSLLFFLLAAVVSAFGYGAAQPMVQTLCMKAVPDARRGAASSTSYIGQDLGNLAGPIVAGLIADKMGYQVMWQMMTIPVLFAMLLVFLFRKRIHAIESDFQAQKT
jgi:MFS family permease